MTREWLDVVLVVLIGPLASGKSTVASGFSQELRRQGELVALVELDQIADMALPTLPSWDVAARIFAKVAAEWATTDLTCVIAEGISSRGELSMLLDHVPAATSVVTVAMTTPFETALVWARADPARTRGMSRDRRWLSDQYDQWSAETPHIGADVLLDPRALSSDEAVSLITAAIQTARSSVC